MEKICKLKKYVFWNFVLMLCMCTSNVYAANCPGGDADCWDHWQGSASSYTIPSSGGNGGSVVNSGAKCGEGALCFNGKGMYIKLLKYNSDTRAEEIVGTPMLIYNSGFLSDASVVLKGVAEDSADMPFIKSEKLETQNDYFRWNMYYGYEEVAEYKQGDIYYCLDHSGNCHKGTPSSVSNYLTVIYDPNLPSDYSQFASYVKNERTGLITKYASTINLLCSSFKLNATTCNNVVADLDKYYLGFETVVRQKRGPEPNTKAPTRTEEDESVMVEKVSVEPHYRFYCSTSRIIPWCDLYGPNRSSSECPGSCPNDTYTSGYTCSNGGEFSTQSDCTASCDGTCSPVTQTRYGYWINYTGDDFRSDGPFTYGVIYYNRLLTQFFSGESEIIPSKYTNKTIAIAGLTTLKDESDCSSDGSLRGNCTKHCVLNKENQCQLDENGNKIYEYFIGPTLKTAMIGWPDAEGNFYNRYRLYDHPAGNGTYFDASQTADRNGNPGIHNVAVGSSYWWMPGVINCKTTCGGKSGDDLLSCAENFCDNSVGYDDRANTQKLKLECMMVACEYTPPPPTNCENNNPYLNQSTPASSTSANSTCNLVDGLGIPSQNNTRIDTSCNSLDTYVPDNRLNEIFDQKTYLSVACKESSSFRFADLSGQRYVAGQGIDYFANLQGEKECTVFFDLNTWKLAYATYHSEDKVEQSDGTFKSSRQLLEEMLAYYNQGVSGEGGGERAIGIDMEGNPVSITWNSFKYNLDKVHVTTAVQEIIDNSPVKSDQYTLIPTNKQVDSSYNVSGTEDMVTFTNLVRKDFKANRYLSDSGASASYIFEKYCVSNDGKATVYKAPANGVCYTSGTGPSAESVMGRNVYFTSLHATPNEEFSEAIKKAGEEHYVGETHATVESDNTGNNYLEDHENCPYVIEGGALQCRIEVVPDEGTTMLGNQVYVNGGVTANLIVDDRLGKTDTVNGVGISTSGAQVNNERMLKLNFSGRHDESITITGVVTTVGGKRVTCEANIQLIPPEDQNCSASCKVQKISDNLYEIVSTKETPTAYYSSLVYGTSLLTGNISWKRLFPDLSEQYFGRYLINVTNREVGAVLYGRVDGVYSNGGACSNYCREPFNDEGTCSGPDCKPGCDPETDPNCPPATCDPMTDPNCPENPNCPDGDPNCPGNCVGPNCLPNCTKDCEPTDKEEIRDYCIENWAIDVNHYVSVEDCMTRCSDDQMPEMQCEEVKCDVGAMQDICRMKASSWKFYDESNCTGYFYSKCGCGGFDYIYRPVNDYNPFPNSYDSNSLGFHYQTGDRIIGANWVGKSKYIKIDDDDTSSVTGAYANQKVEYVIELTPNDVREIRNDTEMYNSMTEGNDAYVDYVYMRGTDTTKKYYSKFINETFRDRFTVIAGEQVR